MSERMIAVFDTPEEAAEAIARLRREGIRREAITVMSAEPLGSLFGENGEPGESDLRPTRIPIFAICGGLLGAACAVALTVLTSRRVGLVTGGMPIVTPWAFGIIVFELTALGAILATFVRMIFEARLARTGVAGVYSEYLAEGRLVLSVECEEPPCEQTSR